jgi:hypothetical protein
MRGETLQSAAPTPAPATIRRPAPHPPATGSPVQCLRGDCLAHYGMTRTYSHRCHLHGTLCLWTWLERDR